MARVVRPDRLQISGDILEQGLFVFEPKSVSLNNEVGVIRQHETGYSVNKDNSREVWFQSDDFAAVLNKGDVLSSDGRGNIRVLLSKSANQNTLLLTDECNNRCTFCSQPPKKSGHYFETAKQALNCYEGSGVIGLTGGEPTLFWDDFLSFIQEVSLSDIFEFHLLSHGRTFEEAARVQSLVECGFVAKTLFGIPVHGPNQSTHDQVTGQKGSFDQTLHGIQNLAFVGAALEIRIILTQQIVPVLLNTIEMLWSHFRWVKPTIALMQLEPVGWGNKNYESLYVDPTQLTVSFDELENFMLRTGCRLALYNFPLCHVPRNLRPIAHQSISDWKNYFADECQSCLIQSKCAGFFKSANGRKRPSIIPIVEL